jgi:rhamnose utilization protein RhaD (predicted bifunctional aldolase and dehydrogenase)
MGRLDALVRLSHRYGSDPDWVLSGGGNSSWKDGSTLYVKASGSSLATIGEEGFCAVDRGKLDAMREAAFPEAAEAREAAVLAALLAARLPGEDKRPSVETLMHGLFREAFVMHTHPAAVNGIACAKGGREAFLRLFRSRAIWVPFIDPGYLLAKAVEAAISSFTAQSGRSPRLMFMENHGLLVSGDSPREIENASDEVMRAVMAEMKRKPDLQAVAFDAEARAEASETILALSGGQTALRFRADAETLRLASSPESFAAIASAFTPDHIVYSGHEYLYSGNEKEELRAAWKDYAARNGVRPKICVIRGLGAFSLGANAAAAETALSLFSDACKIAAYAENFGGASHMKKENIDFIRGWEAERFRSGAGAGA